MKNENSNYNQVLKNAKLQGRENCIAILVGFHAQRAVKNLSNPTIYNRILDNFSKENYLKMTTQKIYKEYAETFSTSELTANQILEMELTTKALNGLLPRNENIEYSVALMG